MADADVLVPILHAIILHAIILLLPKLNNEQYYHYILNTIAISETSP